MSFYKLIKQTFKKTFLADQSIKWVSPQQLILLLQLMGIGLNNVAKKEKNLVKDTQP